MILRYDIAINTFHGYLGPFHVYIKVYVRARIDYFEQEEQYQVKRLFRATTVGRAIIYDNNLRVENSSRLSNPLIRHDTRRIYFAYTYTCAHISTYMHACVYQ